MKRSRKDTTMLFTFHYLIKIDVVNFTKKLILSEKTITVMELKINISFIGKTDDTSDCTPTNLSQKRNFPTKHKKHYNELCIQC